MPFWWDEAGAYIPPALAVAKKGLWTVLPGMHSMGFLEGHPLVLYIVHGALYEVFGRSIWPHRIVQLGLALIGLWFTYRLGRLLWSQWIGVSAAILLATTPMYFAQSSMVLGDLPITALGVASLYFLFTQRFWAYIIVATLLLQTKETALAVSAAAALYDLFRHRIAARRRRSILMHAVPIASLALFFAIEYLATGSFVQASYFDSKPLLIIDLSHPIESIAAALDQAGWVATILFYAEGRFMLTALMFLGVLVHWRKVWTPELVLFAAIILLYWGTFAIIGFLPRYIMPALPYLCLAAAACARAVQLRRIAILCTDIADCSCPTAVLPHGERQWRFRNQHSRRLREKPKDLIRAYHWNLQVAGKRMGSAPLIFVSHRLRNQRST